MQNYYKTILIDLEIKVWWTYFLKIRVNRKLFFIQNPTSVDMEIKNLLSPILIFFKKGLY